MSKRASGTAAIIVVLLATALANFHFQLTFNQKSSTHTWAKFENSALGFTLEYPADILTPEVGATNATTSIALASADKSTYNPDNIRVGMEDTDAKDIDAYLATIQTPYPPKDITIDGLPAREFEELAYADYQIYLLNNGKVYIFTLNLPPTEAEHVKSSIVFSVPPPPASKPEKLQTPEELQSYLQKENINSVAIGIMTNTYLANYWQPLLLKTYDIKDISGDLKDDYFFIVEDVLNKHLSEDPNTEGKNRRLVILLSLPNNSYQVIEGKDIGVKLSCGKCGGTYWGIPLVHVDTATSSFSVNETTGSFDDTSVIEKDFWYSNDKLLITKEIYTGGSLVEAIPFTGTETDYTYTSTGNGQYSISTTTKQITLGSNSDN